MKKLIHILSLLIFIVIGPIDCKSNPIVIQPITIIEVPPAEIIAETPKVVLITLDGVRWQEIFNGTDLFLYRGKKLTARELLPNLYHHFVDNGMVLGKDSEFVATGPRHISLPGYLEMMRGHPSTDCQSNECEHPKLDGTVADLFQESAVFASWDTIKRTVPDKFVVNCGRHYRSPAWVQIGLKDNKGFPEYWDPEYRPDVITEQAALDYLRDHRPGFTWISLGDTDEWAHAGNYNQYLEALKQADEFVGQVIKLVNESPDGKNYTFIVTADHGRSLFWRDHGGDNESARDWLMITGRKIAAKGFVKYKERRSLSNILPTVKELVSGVHTEKSLL